jgi:hypothetical protein
MTSIVTLYMDESATDDNQPIAVVGGLLLDKYGLQGFNPGWAEILSEILHCGTPAHQGGQAA